MIKHFGHISEVTCDYCKEPELLAKDLVAKKYTIIDFDGRTGHACQICTDTHKLKHIEEKE